MLKKIQYKKFPAKELNKKLYWDAKFAKDIPDSIIAIIHKDKIKLPNDFIDSLNNLSDALEEYINCVDKYLHMDPHDVI